MKIQVDMNELKKFRMRIGNAAVQDTIQAALKEAIAESLRHVKPNTPVDTGTLRRGWKVTNIQKEGNAYVAYLYNDVKYAMHIEYGHRTRINQKTGLRKSFVPGVYMMRFGCQEVQNDMPRIVKKHIDKFCRKMGYT